MTRRRLRRLLRRTAAQTRATQPIAFRNGIGVYASRFRFRDYLRWAHGVPHYHPDREDVFAPSVHRRDEERGR